MFIGDLLEFLAVALLATAAFLAFGTAASLAVAGVGVFWIAQGFANTPVRRSGEAVAKTEAGP